MIQEHPYRDHVYIHTLTEYDINGQKVWDVYCAFAVASERMFVSDYEIKSLIGTRKFYANIRQAMRESGQKWRQAATLGCGFTVYASN